MIKNYVRLRNITPHCSTLHLKRQAKEHQTNRKTNELIALLYFSLHFCPFKEKFICEQNKVIWRSSWYTFYDN